MFRLTILLTLLCISPGVGADTEEVSQIVTTCHYANAEWGSDMINRCIEENRALRDEVLRLPPEHAKALARCREHAELGWGWVRDCVLKGKENGNPSTR